MFIYSAFKGYERRSVLSRIMTQPLLLLRARAFEPGVVGQALLTMLLPQHKGHPSLSEAHLNDFTCPGNHLKHRFLSS